MGYYVNPSAESFAAIARSKSGFYQYCKSNIKQKKIQEVSIKTAFALYSKENILFRLLEQEEKVLLLTQLQSGAAVREKKCL